MGLNKTESFGDLHFKLAPTQQNIIHADRKIWRGSKKFLMEQSSLKVANRLFIRSNFLNGPSPASFSFI